MDVTFFTDPAAFLAAAGPAIDADPLHHSVIAVVAQRAATNGLGEGPFWFATITDPAHPDALPQLAMRTHPDTPHAGYVPSLTPAAAHALADALDTRGEQVIAWNGDLETAIVLAGRAAPGADVVVDLHTRLWELSEVIWPPAPAGTLRAATPDDVDLLTEWILAFHRDAEVQGGREPGTKAHQPLRESVARRTATTRELFLFEVDGTPVHLTGVTPPVGDTVRIGPVYTPLGHRGHGYAAHVVATIAQRILDDGLRPCLYTDQANPVSNKVYQRIGFVPLGDEGNVRAVVD